MMDNRDMPEIPIQKWRPISHKQETVGLTARAHFAGLAMQGILSNPVIMDRLLEQDDVSVDTLVSSLAEVNAGSLLEALEKDNSKVMSNAVDVEQELIRLKDEASELRIELALERAKVVSRNEFIASLLKGES